MEMAPIGAISMSTALISLRMRGFRQYRDRQFGWPGFAPPLMTECDGGQFKSSATKISRQLNELAAFLFVRRIRSISLGYPMGTSRNQAQAKFLVSLSV